MCSKLFLIALLTLSAPACTLLPARNQPVAPPNLPDAAPVTPEEITPANAYDKAQELQRELNRDIEG